MARAGGPAAAATVLAVACCRGAHAQAQEGGGGGGGGGGSHTAAIIAGVVLGVVFCALAVGLVFFVKWLQGVSARAGAQQEPAGRAAFSNPLYRPSVAAVPALGAAGEYLDAPGLDTDGGVGSAAGSSGGGTDGGTYAFPAADFEDGLYSEMENRNPRASAASIADYAALDTGVAVQADAMDAAREASDSKQGALNQRASAVAAARAKAAGRAVAPGGGGGGLEGGDNTDTLPGFADNIYSDEAAPGLPGLGLGGGNANGSVAITFESDYQASYAALDDGMVLQEDAS